MCMLRSSCIRGLIMDDKTFNALLNSTKDAKQILGKKQHQAVHFTYMNPMQSKYEQSFI